MPVRETFGLVPEGSELILYVLFLPALAALVFGLYKRFARSGLGILVARGPGGVRGALARLVQYGLFQRRVARRPRGWPHLAIFYGFLTLLFGTGVVALDWNVLRPMGVRLLAGNPYLYLELLLDALGLVFVVGLIAALIWRTIRLRSAEPNERHVQWQFLALIMGLLFLGITGFALEALRLILQPVPWAGWSFVGDAVAQLLQGLGVDATARTGAVYTALWWIHAVVAFVLIGLLPFSVFLHSVGGPLNLAVHGGRPRLALDTPFDLRELQETGDFDVKPGVATVQELDAGSRLALGACTNCGRCDEVCPAFAAGTDLSPRRLVQSLRWRVLEDDLDNDVLENGIIGENELWACTTCAACVEACPVLIRPVDYIVPFRRELVARQKLQKRQADFLGNLGLSMNPYGLPAAQRAQLPDELDKDVN